MEEINLEEYLIPFKIGLKAIVRNCNSIIDNFNEMNELINNEKLNRDERKMFKKKYISNKNTNFTNQHKKLLNYANNCLISLEDNDVELNEDIEFDYLLLIIIDTYDILKEKINPNTNITLLDFSKKIFGAYVNDSKCENINLNIFKFFDEKGNVIPETCDELKYYILSLKDKINYPRKFDLESLNEVLVSDMEFEYAKKIKDEKRKKTEEVKQNPKKELIIKNTVTSTSTEKEAVKQDKSKYNSQEYQKLRSVFNIETRELKKGCSTTLTINEFIEMIKPFVEKKELNTLIDSFREDEKNIKIEKIKRILSKSEYRKVENLLKSLSEEDTFIVEFEDLILSDDFNKLNDAEIKNRILSSIEKCLNPSDQLCNLIIFPSEEFVKTEINKINNARTFANNEKILNVIPKQLIYLRNNDINELKSNGSNAFHELKDNDKESFIIDNKLKGYRFGARKSKICLFNISVNQDNQKILYDKYHMESNSKLLLVFGMSNVEVENEFEFYERAIKYAKDIKERLLEIYDIFSKPFTNETFNKATQLIENGFEIIYNLTENEKTL